MAPESLRHNLYTYKSDVWSFGITVWEILTFGARPYQGLGAKELIRLIFGGKRLEQPATATIDLYAVLLECKFEFNNETRKRKFSFFFLFNLLLYAVINI